jgi:hypothetical protein
MDVDTTSTWAPGSIVTVDVSYDVAPVGIDLLGTFGFDGTLSVRRTAQVDQ